MATTCSTITLASEMLDPNRQSDYEILKTTIEHKTELQLISYLKEKYGIYVEPSLQRNQIGENISTAKNIIEHKQNIIIDSINKSVHLRKEKAFLDLIRFVLEDSLARDVQNFNSVKTDSENAGSKFISLTDRENLISATSKEELLETWKLLKSGNNISNDLIELDDPIKSCTHLLVKDSIQTSVSYLILTQENPIPFAIYLSNTFEDYSQNHREVKKEYEALASDCSNLAVDLLNCCVSFAEVEIILKQSTFKEVGSNANEGLCKSLSCVSCHRMSKDDQKYPLLHYAIRTEQKDFIAHPYCQVTVETLWTTVSLKRNHENKTSRKREIKSRWMWTSSLMKGIFNMLLVSLLYLLHKFISIFNCKVLENFKLLQAAYVPMNRFIYFVVSYSIFLICLLITSTDESESLTPVKSYDWIIITYTIGLGGSLIMDWCRAINHRRLPFFWTFYESLMVLTLFIGSSCMLFAWFDLSFAKYLVLAGEFCYALGISLSFIRILQWFHLSFTLGHIIVSISQMTNILLKLMIIFAVVIVSFLQGVHFLYKDYNVTDSDSDKGVFINYGRTFEAFFWALFGYGESSYAQLPPNATKIRHTRPANLTLNHNEIIVSYLGQGLWGLFQIAVVIILLNMLIAIMTNSFEDTTRNSDTEWKFAKTQLQWYYFERNSFVPPPLNLIALSLQFFKWIRKLFMENEVSSQKIQKKKEKEKELSRNLVLRLLYHRAFSSPETTRPTSQTLFLNKDELTMEYLRPRNSFRHRFMSSWR